MPLERLALQFGSQTYSVPREKAQKSFGLQEIMEHNDSFDLTFLGEHITPKGIENAIK